MKLMNQVFALPTLLLVFVSFSCTKTAPAQETVPEKIKTAFSQKFPEATDVKWDKESNTEWEAEFKMKGKEYSSNFTTDGQWVETEYEVETAAIPQVIKTDLEASFAGYTVKKAELSEKSTGQLYEIEIEKGTSSIEAVYDANGTLVKQSNEDKENEKDGDKDKEEDDDDKEGDKK